MNRLVVIAAAAALATLPGLPASAKSLTFTVKNTSKYIISSFQSNEGNGWSKNWIRSDIGSGQSRALEFLQDGPCEIEVRVGWRTTDGGQQVGDAWEIDICEAHTVYFDGRKVTFD
ncbi:hypothetical protein GCM10007036_08280 [Alsobacter metallidurans]|uniref:Uncharacterized protein n=1 Tax=Alsobacter metallidurans TaxID=340221 RepID=A0A917MFV6_9HYPH|nr:hypothetical protein [Alsobacter metallidurans]GGH11320.1 hypothetical protein GCM10007036_08280 [Alsobacter metallidurans]